MGEPPQQFPHPESGPAGDTQQGASKVEPSSRKRGGRRWWNQLALWLLGISILTAALQWGSFLYINWQVDRQAVAVGQEAVERIEADITAEMERVQRVTQQLASVLERESLDQQRVGELLKRTCQKEPLLLGVTAAYVPEAFSPDRRLYAPFYDLQLGKIIQCESLYDYTAEASREEARWYQAAAEAGEPCWVSGYGPAAQTTYVGYSVPFYGPRDTEQSRSLRGVVNASISLKAWNNLLNTENVGRLGLGLLVDQNGTLVDYSETEYAVSGKTFTEAAEELQSPELKQAATRMLAGETGYVRFRGLRGIRAALDGWFFFTPLPAAGWSIGVAILENELPRPTAALRRWQLGLTINLLITFTLLAIVWLNIESFDEGRLWILGMCFVLVGSLGVGRCWQLAAYYRQKHSSSEDLLSGGRSVLINDSAGLREFVKRRELLAKDLHQPKILTIPTGIFLEAVDFRGPNLVRVSGFLWQRYQNEVHDHLPRGVVFSELAPDPEGFSWKEHFREREGSVEIVCWRFQAVIQDRFDYRNFPLDRQLFDIRLRHPHWDRNVILIPDLQRYPIINSLAQPGLAEELTVPSWSVRNSFFSYQLVNYNTVLGRGQLTGQREVPELRFNVLLVRNFLTPFISYVVPLAIVLLLLHGVLISAGVSVEKQKSTGFSIFGVLQASGAFFFAILLMHIDLRGRLKAETITYLESLYILAYVMLLLVVVNSLLLKVAHVAPLIRYRDNALARLLYLPVTVLLIFCLTIWTFW